jgi:hypothetical protein
MNPPPTLFIGMVNIPDGVFVSNEGEVATIEVNGTIIETLLITPPLKLSSSMPLNGIDSVF